MAISIRLQKTNRPMLFFISRQKKWPSNTNRYFHTLAKEYNCTIVAGSIVLPAAAIGATGELEIKKTGELYNTSVVFGNDGKILPPLIRKQFPIDEELGFTQVADQSQQPIFTTKAGRMAVLICADSWYPQAYANLTNKVDFIVVPSLGAKRQYLVGSLERNTTDRKRLLMLTQPTTKKLPKVMPGSSTVWANGL